MIIGIRVASLDVCQCIHGPSIVIEIHVEISADLSRDRRLVIITKIPNEIFDVPRFSNYRSNAHRIFTSPRPIDANIFRNARFRIFCNSHNQPLYRAFSKFQSSVVIDYLSRIDNRQPRTKRDGRRKRNAHKEKSWTCEQPRFVLRIFQLRSRRP